MCYAQNACDNCRCHRKRAYCIFHRIPVCVVVGMRGFLIQPDIPFQARACGTLITARGIRERKIRPTVIGVA